MPVQTIFSRQSKPGGNIVIISLSGRFVGKESEDFIKEVDGYMAAVQTNQPDDGTGLAGRLIIDLANLEYISSRGAGALFTLTSNYQVKIVNISPLIRNTFSLLQLDQLFEIYSSREEALKTYF